MNIYVIYGPTASGKSKLARELLLKNPNTTLLLSVDSRKVYKNLDIGTNKKPLIDFFQKGALNMQNLLGINLFEVTDKLSVKGYVDKISEQLKLVSKNKDKQIHTLIIFGGSALYLNAILYGIDTLNISRNKLLRSKENLLTVKQLQDILQEFGKEWLDFMNASDALNKRRLLRRIEIAQHFKKYSTYTKHLKSTSQKNYFSIFKKLGFSVDKITMYLPNYHKLNFREALYARINNRVEAMINSGWVNEVIEVIAQYKVENYNVAPAGLKIMGYKHITKYILDTKAKENINIPIDIVDKIKQEHRHYAKTQLNWVRKFKSNKDFAIMHY